MNDYGHCGNCYYFYWYHIVGGDRWCQYHNTKEVDVDGYCNQYKEGMDFDGC